MQAEDSYNFLTEPANASWLNAQHGNRSCCCGCSGKEIYLLTAKIAPSLRKFLTPCVPVRHGTVGSIVVLGTTARVLFTKLGKLCVFYAVRTRRRACLNPFYSDLSLFYFYATAPKGAALKKQFTPPPLCAALGGTGGSVNCFLPVGLFFKFI